MELQPKDSSLFRQAIESLKDFLPEAQLCVNEQGLTISGMDASHVGFAKYVLAAADCTVLKVPIPQTLGVPLGTVARILASMGSNDQLVITSNDTHLVITATSDKTKKKTKGEAPLMDITVDALEIPETTYAGNLKAKTSDLATACKEVAAFGDSLQFFVNDDGFHISAKSELGSMTQVLENIGDDRDMDFTAEMVRPVGFGAKYITSMLKCGVSPNVNIGFDETQPMRLVFSYGVGSSLVFHLAPKMVDE
jgi:proliferating cell nuclear antigen PCNA